MYIEVSFYIYVDIKNTYVRIYIYVIYVYVYIYRRSLSLALEEYEDEMCARSAVKVVHTSIYKLIHIYRY
jgi:hypothetical protein